MPYADTPTGTALEKKRKADRKERIEKPELVRARQRRYKEKNKEKIREKDKKYREANRESIRKRAREGAKKRYAANPDKYRNISKDWALKNPDKVRAADKKSKSKRKYINAKLAREYRLKNHKHILSHQRECRKNLADWYVKYVIMQRWSFKSTSEIPQGLIDFKRAELKLKRTIKEKEENEA